MENNKNADVKKINQECLEAGVSEKVLNYIDNNVELFARLSDDNFEDNSNTSKFSDS